MSKTLNFVESLMRRARACHDLGLNHQAKDLFGRLASFRRLPEDVAEETQLRLAELCGADNDAANERLHLACALAQRPDSADHHRRMAAAYRSDEDAPQENALPHLEAAVRLNPDNPRYRAELGDLLCHLGRAEEGLGQLKAAYDLADDDLAIVEQYAYALAGADRLDEARELLKTAMFRNSGDRRFRDAFRDFQFRAVANEQKREAAPVLLPFRRVAARPRRFAIDGQLFRMDGAEPLAGPARRSPSRREHTK